MYLRVVIGMFLHGAHTCVLLCVAVCTFRHGRVGMTRDELSMFHV